jgi:FdrA protein
MTLLATVRPHRYADSVKLMAIAGALEGEPGVRRAALFMATPANLEMLRAAGLLPDPAPACGPDDLLVAVDAESAEAAARAMERADGLLAPPPRAAGSEAAVTPRTLEAGAAQVGATLASLSVPGEYATVEAFAALRQGLDVFCFSDHVSVADEVALKREAHARGRLLMGPDCGTSYWYGTGLGFHNAVRSGAVGIVAASGTGLQAAACLLDRWGAGVSLGIGTGGRDLLDEVGGITTLDALDRLSDDPATHVILLLAKAADPATGSAVLQMLSTLPKPAVAWMAGHRASRQGVLLQPTIRAATAAAARAVGVTPPPPATPAIPPAGEGQIVGLFTGGSMLAEAEGVLREAVDPARLGALVDFGSEEYTRGRPHPMIDPKPRAEALRAAVERSGTAVVLFDVILGFGAHPDPAGAVVEALMRAKPPAAVLVAVLCGTDQDVQGYSQQRARLEKAGVLVFDSAAEAAGAAAIAVRAVRAAR